MLVHGTKQSSSRSIAACQPREGHSLLLAAAVGGQQRGWRAYRLSRRKGVLGLDGHGGRNRAELLTVGEGLISGTQAL